MERGIRSFVGSSRELAVTRNRTLQLSLDAGNGNLEGSRRETRALARTPDRNWRAGSATARSSVAAGTPGTATSSRFCPRPHARAELAGIGWRPAAAAA